jgi:hypothetical protein
MKKIVILFSLALLSFTKSDEPIERIGVKGPLKFNGTSFFLSWSDHPKDFYYIQEYLPEGEKGENFNQMLTLHLFDKNTSAEGSMRQKIKELELRKKTDQLCNYEVNESPDGKEFIIDCILSQSKDDKVTIAEFNLYRYKQIDLGNNKTGILVYAYSKRSYGDAITDFLKKLTDDRPKMLHSMIYTTLPFVKISN